MAKLDENGLLYLWQRFKAIFVTKDELSNYGAGDMLKSTYDTDNNGKVDNADNADKLGGQSPEYYAPKAELFSGKYEDLKDKPDEFTPTDHTHEMGEINGLNETAQQLSAELGNAIENVTEIASGKCASYVFDTPSELASAIAEYKTFVESGTEMSETNPLRGKTLKTGDVFLITALDVPDYWWDGESNQTQILETTKVDVTPITNAEIDEILSK